MNLSQHSLKITIVVGTLFVLLFSFSVAAWYTINASEKKLYKEFKDERNELTEKISEAMREPIYYLSPNNGSLVISLIKQDERIAALEVYDKFNEMEFIKFIIPERKQGRLFKNSHEVINEGEDIGVVNIVFNDKSVRKEILTKQELIIKVFAFTFFVIAIFMMPLLYFIVFKPLGRLIKQAKSFQKNELEKCYVWQGDSEVSVVGQSFESARISTLELVEELKASNKQLEQLAITDNLTGLFNRHKLAEILEREKLRFQRYGNKFCIILLDIDHFKRVNDTYGHQIGDEILKAFANILKDNTREHDFVARWGGEEFLIVCPESNIADTCLLAEKLRNIIQKYKFPVTQPQTASFGIAEFECDESISVLEAKADKALYQAKAEGRNKVVIH